MAEYIEREELISELDELISNVSFSSPYQDEVDRMIIGMERSRDCVENAETADVVPVVHGRWVKQPTQSVDVSTELSLCSVCAHMVSTYWGRTKYCPNCGARMDG